MEIPSPLAKLLRWERAPDPSPSLRTGGGQPSATRTAVVQRTADLSAHNIFRQLYALSPKDLQRFVSQQLPFLNDPYFSRTLARGIPSSNTREGEGFEKPTDSHLVRDKAGGIWKVWMLPVAIEGRLAKITIYLSQKGQKKEKERDKGKDKNKQRIILATELDHTGPIEIEADIVGNSLLLALRSTRPFSALTQTGIRERFLQILEAVRLHGSINFYTVSDLLMDALESPTAWEVEL